MRRLVIGLVVASVSTTMFGQGHIKDSPNVTMYRPSGQLDDGFAFCYLHFSRDRIEPSSSGWNTDYPGAGLNLMMRLPEISYLRTVEEGGHEPRQWVTSVDRDDIFLCPFLLVSDGGTMNLGPDQARRLGAYLRKGGFLWIDDTWGSESWSQVLRELGKAVPSSWRIETPTFGHPIYRMLYHVRETLQVSHASHWASTLRTDERGEDSPLTPLRVLVDDRGRVAAILTHNTDVADTWEREHLRPYFEEFAADGYALAANVVLHAMTH